MRPELDDIETTKALRSGWKPDPQNPNDHHNPRVE